MDEIIRKLQAVNYTLDQIEVRGQANLNKMLGCMQTLQEITAQLQQTKTQPTEAVDK